MRIAGAGVAAGICAGIGAAGAAAGIAGAAAGAGAAAAPRGAVVVVVAGNAAGGGSNVFFAGDMNGSWILGKLPVTPFDPFGRISGVIITTSSVWPFCAALLLNSRPRTGMSPMPGIFWTDEFIVLFNRPAMENVWP